MKNIKRIVAMTVLGAMLTTNISLVNAEWIHTKEILHHSIHFLMTKDQKNANKDRQLCKKWTSFDILNDDGTLDYTYYPKWCQPKIDYSKIKLNTDVEFDWNDYENNSDWVDDFIKNLFWEKKIEETDVMKDEQDTIMEDDMNFEEMNEENFDFVDDLFSDNSEESEEENLETEYNDQPIDNETEAGEEDFDDMDDMLKEIFWKANTEYKIGLKWKQIVSAIREFNSSKVKIRVWNIEVNVLANDMNYNSKVANLLKQIDNEFKIDSIKNDFAKNISRVSYSLSTYNDTIDLETKEVFRNKLVNDLRKLKKKYKILKKKDRIISKSLEKRGQL